MKRLLPCAALLLMLIPTGAHAGGLNLFAGSQIGSGERGALVAEYTLPMIANVGPFVEWNRTMAAGPENRFFGGLVGRITTPWLGFFVDGRAGYNWNGTEANVTGKDGFNLEFGAGYRLSGSSVDLLPRIGFNAVTANDDLPRVNLMIGISIYL